MSKWLNAKVGMCASFLLISFLITLLSSCASSNVSRNTAANVDLGVQNAKSLAYGLNADVFERYQLTSQATKGAIIGGAAGGLVGISSSIGLLPGLVTGTLLGASYGAYIDTHTNLKDQLENRGVTLVELGDQILIVIPSARVFRYMTPTIKPQAYSTLRLVTRYINRYTKILVKVTGYTNNSCSSAADFALSREQAQNVSKFLWASGLDARLLYAEGCGSNRLVAHTSLDWNANENYRIEITLEKLYV